MSETHIFPPSEYMETIAEHYGFRDHHTIYDDANNAALKTKRPMVLAARIQARSSDGKISKRWMGHGAA